MDFLRVFMGCRGKEAAEQEATGTSSCGKFLRMFTRHRMSAGFICADLIRSFLAQAHKCTLACEMQLTAARASGLGTCNTDFVSPTGDKF